MGADIHVYVEYRNKKQSKDLETRGMQPYWYSFGGELNPGRNYTMFAVLAGVRGDFKDSFDAKGKIPFDLMGSAAKHDLYAFIADGDSENEEYVNREKAKEYEEKFRCSIVNDTWVEKPYYHSHSWMDVKELKKAFKIYLKYAKEEWGEKAEVPLEWRAILSAMETLEDGKKNEVRMVFHFDS